MANDHSAYYELVKRKYDSEKWTRSMLRALVASGRITEEEYREITGEDY